MHLLIDSDSLCYAAGFVANEEGQEALACYQVSESIKRILQDTQCDTYQLYLSGSNNFRYNIYPEYKGNRVDMKRPVHLQALREYLVAEWGATVTDGNEADDAVVIAQYSGDGDTAIAHIDKDIGMAEGRHYNFVKKTWYDVSSEQAMRHFYWQLIMGDRSDNIPGYDGKMRTTVPKFLMTDVMMLQGMDAPEDMFEHVAGMWGALDDKERLLDFNKAAHCLWIQRTEYDDWRNYLNDYIIKDFGLPVDSIHSLPAPFEQPAEDGHQSISV